MIRRRRLAPHQDVKPVRMGRIAQCWIFALKAAFRLLNRIKQVEGPCDRIDITSVLSVGKRSLAAHQPCVLLTGLFRANDHDQFISFAGDAAEPHRVSIATWRFLPPALQSCRQLVNSQALKRANIPRKSCQQTFLRPLNLLPSSPGMVRLSPSMIHNLWRRRNIPHPPKREESASL